MTARTLVLLRHAKAEHPAGVADVDRPLTARGHADAAAAGAWLASQRLVPDLVLCSPSRRTRETWHCVALALGGGAAPEPVSGAGEQVHPRPQPVPVVFEPAVYHADVPDLVDLLAGIDEGVGTLLVIGHNPTLSTLSAALDPAGGPEDGLRTCGLAVHRLADGWRRCGPRLAALAATHTARA
jgi:phosphohistidine phosphatase